MFPDAIAKNNDASSDRSDQSDKAPVGMSESCEKAVFVLSIAKYTLSPRNSLLNFYAFMILFCYEVLF